MCSGQHRRFWDCGPGATWPMHIPRSQGHARAHATSIMVHHVAAVVHKDLWDNGAAAVEAEMLPGPSVSQQMGMWSLSLAPSVGAHGEESPHPHLGDVRALLPPSGTTLSLSVLTARAACGGETGRASEGGVRMCVRRTEPAQGAGQAWWVWAALHLLLCSLGEPVPRLPGAGQGT